MIATPPSQSVPRVATDSSTPQQARLETVLIIGGLLAMVVTFQFGIFGDGRERYNMLNTLLQSGQLTARKYSLIGPIFSAPLWYLGKIIQTSEWWVARYNFIVFAIGMLVMYRLLRNRVDRSLLRKFFLLLIAASMFGYHLHWYYGEVFTAVCVGVGLLVAVLGSPVPGWVAVVLGVANTPASVVGLGAVVFKRILDTQRWRYVLAFAAAAALIGFESWLRRGSPSTTNYEPGFTNPIFFGIISDLFSFGAGILFFAPGLLLPIKRRLRALRDQGMGADLYSVYVLWMLFLIGLILVYANWYDWSGAWFWGPRFFLFASIPASFALAVRLHQRDMSLVANLITAGVLLLSCWVGLNGSAFGTVLLDTGFHGYTCLGLVNFPSSTCYDIPELSVLWQPFIAASELHWNPFAFIAAEHMAKSTLAYTGYLLVVYAYLVLPLLYTIAKQTRALVVNYARTTLRRFAF